MTRLGMLIDVTRCSGCYNCFLACRDEHYGNDYPGYSAAQPLNGQFWMQMKEVEGGKYPRPRLNYIAIPCQHCQNAPCIDAAKDGAVYRRDDGIVHDRPREGEGAGPDRGLLPVPRHLLERRAAAAAEVRPLRPAPRHRRQAAALRRVLPDRRDGVRRPRRSRVRDLAAPRARSRPRSSTPSTGPTRSCVYAGLPGRMVAGEVVLEGSRRLRRGRQGHARGRRRLPGDDVEDVRRLRVRAAAAGQGVQGHGRADGYAPQVFDVKTHTDVDLGEVVLTR